MVWRVPCHRRYAVLSSEKSERGAARTGAERSRIRQADGLYMVLAFRPQVSDDLEKFGGKCLKKPADGRLYFT